ncbi:2-oxoacid:acceptor oxidoreductase family protein, partial [Candidatus Bipolaricaulota bacterium]|nr:2-oxoacid:acceptor oxidoreductase family protein [Candidatus Bipolaricaulota bacterium]
DIGCVGLADKYFPSHTIHGLHGRSPALAAGIRFRLQDPSKHIIVYIGDGGATIGLQHLMEAARLNVNMTVVVHNNMLYGMTGGQSSGLTPEGYATTTEREGSVTGSYDLPQAVNGAGAGFSARVLFNKGLVDELEVAFESPGFSLIEVMEYCLSYGHKYNPETRIEDILEKQDRPLGRWTNEDRLEYVPEKTGRSTPLFSDLPDIPSEFPNELTEPVAVLIGGSAGEGVQTAAKVFAQAAMRAGLEVSKKGEYPVTVGSGFSAVELLMSPEKIEFTGIDSLENVIMVSSVGLDHSYSEIESMQGGVLVGDESLDLPEVDGELIQKPFRDKAGGKGAALSALTYWLDQAGIFPMEALDKAAETSKHSDALKESIKVGTDL